MSQQSKLVFNPPPTWPKPPEGWVPPNGWTPDPAWPPPPAGWKLWIPEGAVVDGVSTLASASDSGVSASEDQRLAVLEEENAILRRSFGSAGDTPDGRIVLDDDRVLQEVGIYRYHHPLETAVAYRERLDDIATRIVDMIRANTAIEKSDTFTFDGSLAKGRSMTNDLAKLMLRAYNAEAENVVRALRAGNAVTAIKRLDAARSSIAKLGKIMTMQISETFHKLRIEEIELTAYYLMKKEAEREAARAERERLREERKIELELAAAREKLEKEKAHILTVIAKVKEGGASDPALAEKLLEINGAIEQNDYRAANIRAGYVYIISNRGAFGGHVMKIGLTRRLDPLDRILELGDASVPFRFDVHALFFSGDAVTLEGELHEHFSAFRMNWANNKKEFFFVSPVEVRKVLAEKLGNLLEFAEHVESTEYLQSIRYWPEHLQPK